MTYSRIEAPFRHFGNLKREANQLEQRIADTHPNASLSGQPGQC
ncbi:hypothetical protein GCM10023310_00440 [Paenibacillus vulneris]|uniref:Uncharacterized protein n=1 Tax=Paenibacillus vulneris TaxID=1133364 RepID=A0ABW3UYN4_9BACL|nr:hypothetical protein [Paenibacillus sp. OAS669]MBE1447370.1 hypothetical protein [Paenibacillus sp. OAS669]